MKRGTGVWREMYPNKRPKAKGSTPGGQNRGCGTVTGTVYAQTCQSRTFPPNENVMKKKKGKV